LRDFGVKKSLSLLYVDIYQMIIDSLQNISVRAASCDGNMALPEHGMSAICKNQYVDLSGETGRLMPSEFPGFSRWHSSPGAQHVIRRCGDKNSCCARENSAIILYNLFILRLYRYNGIIMVN
jgi:hypothetical protein